MIDIGVSEEPLDVGAAVEAVRDPDCGGIGLFVGTVRSEAQGEAVLALEYDVHADIAEDQMRTIGKAAASRWDVHHVYIRHRSGTCGPGEPTVIVACSAPHRADALGACRYIIDALKTEVAVWKREITETGSRWVEAG